MCLNILNLITFTTNHYSIYNLYEYFKAFLYYKLTHCYCFKLSAVFDVETQVCKFLKCLYKIEGKIESRTCENLYK